MYTSAIYTSGRDRQYEKYLSPKNTTTPSSESLLPTFVFLHKIQNVHSSLKVVALDSCHERSIPTGISFFQLKYKNQSFSNMQYGRMIDYSVNVRKLKDSLTRFHRRWLL